jgi:hypothetical protein
MTTASTWLGALRRRWVFPGLGDARPGRRATYTWFDLDRQPPATADARSAIEVLLEHPPRADGLDDDDAVRRADGEGLDAILAGDAVGPLPPSFERFIREREPRRRIRSVTACFLDLGEHAVHVDEGPGHLIHFLSDQQWVVHWLVFVPHDSGPSPVLASTSGYGLPSYSDAPPEFRVKANHWEDEDARTVVCADSIDEFLIRFFLENEAWRIANGRMATAEAPIPAVMAYLEAVRMRNELPAPGSSEASGRLNARTATRLPGFGAPPRARSTRPPGAHST